MQVLPQGDLQQNGINQMKINSGVGTLVLYDSENLAIPVRPDNTHYIVDKIDMPQLREAIEREYPTLGMDFIVFSKRLTDNSSRASKITSFFKFLYSSGFDIISKAVTTRKRFIKLASGESVLYHYEKCDLDTDMIKVIDEKAHLYQHIILVSGDDDMLPALLNARDNFGVRITAISHKESMSSSFRNIDNIYIDELLARRDEHAS